MFIEGQTMKHIETNGQVPLSAFRKISIGNWWHPRDPQTYAEVELNIKSRWFPNVERVDPMK